MSDDFKNISWPDWETVRLIGRGSFGAVYEIQRQVFDDTEKAALKVISVPQNSSDIEEMYNDGYNDESITSTFKSHLQSIVAEYSLMRKMNGSSNIVNCDDVRYVQHNNAIGWDIFIKMELLTPLVKTLSSNIEEETVVRIGKDICSALVLCKKHGILHRDIKPQNIFVSANGDYKLGDFGIAKTIERTMGGTKIGTYKYMAPEVYNNQPYGCSADIYSLGLVLYWLLNERRLPFMPLPPAITNYGDEEKAKQRRFSGEAIPAPKNGSATLKAIILKACAYDPKERYQTAAEMLRDIESVLEKPEPSSLMTHTPEPPALFIPEQEAPESLAPSVSEQEASEISVPSVSEQETSESSVLSVPEQETPAHATPLVQELELPTPKKENSEKTPANKQGEKKKRKFWWVAVLAVVVAGIAIAAFLPKQPATQSPAEIRPTGNGPTTEILRFAFISNGTAPDIEIMASGFQKACENMGIDHTIEMIQAPSAEEQTKIIDDMITQGVDGIAIDAADTNRLKNVLEKAKNSGISVVTLNRDTAGSQLFVNSVGITEVAQAMLDAVYDITGGAGQFAVLSSVASATNQNAWIAAMKKIMKDDAKYSKLDWVETVYGDDIPETAKNEARKLMQKYPDLECICSPTTVGIVACADVVADYRSSVKVTGLGLPSQMKDHIGREKPCPYMFFWDPDKLGKTAAYVLREIVNGTTNCAVGEQITVYDGSTYTVLNPDAYVGDSLQITISPLKITEENIERWAKVY